MQMERCELRARRRPVGGGDPAPTVFQLARGITLPAAAPHDEYAHRWFVEFRTLHHMVEEMQPIGTPVASLRAQRSIGAEFHIAEICVPGIVMFPRPQASPLPCTPR